MLYLLPENICCWRDMNETPRLSSSLLSVSSRSSDRHRQNSPRESVNTTIPSYNACVPFGYINLYENNSQKNYVDTSSCVIVEVPRLDECLSARLPLLSLWTAGT